MKIVSACIYCALTRIDVAPLRVSLLRRGRGALTLATQPICRSSETGPALLAREGALAVDADSHRAHVGSGALVDI